MLLYNLTTNNFNKQKLQTERKYKTKNVYTAQAIFAFHFRALFQHQAESKGLPVCKLAACSGRHKRPDKYSSAAQRASGRNLPACPESPQRRSGIILTSTIRVAGQRTGWPGGLQLTEERERYHQYGCALVRQTQVSLVQPYVKNLLMFMNMRTKLKLELELDDLNVSFQHGCALVRQPQPCATLCKNKSANVYELNLSFHAFFNTHFKHFFLLSIYYVCHWHDNAM